MPSKNPVSFDADNRQLRSVKAFFADAENGVINFSWNPTVKNGAVIAKDRLLFTIRWDGDEEEEVRAPAGCAGTVIRTNRQGVDYDLLGTKAFWLVDLEPEDG